MIKKGGTILINKNKIGLIYRSMYNDYTFPKGHLEEGESLLECAIRETNEETKREVIVLSDTPIINKYTDSKGNECYCEYYIVKDNGKSDNKSTEVHDLVWTDFGKVEEVLTFDSLKEMWNNNKNLIKEYLED